MVEASAGATLYEILLFRAGDDYREAMRDDRDIEGEHRFLLELARASIEEDEEYLDAYEELLVEQAAMPEGEDEDEWNRNYNLKHFGLIIAALRRRGYLDHAPVPESDGGLNFL